MNSKFITSKVQMGPLLNTTGESDVHWERRAPTCFSCQPATARRTDVCFLSLSSTDSRAVSRQNLATLAPTAPGFVVMPKTDTQGRSVYKLSQRPNHKSQPPGLRRHVVVGGKQPCPSVGQVRPAAAPRGCSLGPNQRDWLSVAGRHHARQVRVRKQRQQRKTCIAPANGGQQSSPGASEVGGTPSGRGQRRSSSGALSAAPGVSTGRCARRILIRLAAAACA